MSMTLKEAMKLNGVQDLLLTQPQQKFLIVSTESLLKQHPEEWFKENRVRLRMELERLFAEYLP